jgi:hypothetical protein
MVKICNPITGRCIKNDIKGLHKSNSKMSSNDKLFFYSKSRNVVSGKGTNEFVEVLSLYAELAAIKDWRKVLSNFHVCPFVYEGYTYKTIEHVFQAKKIELADKEKALWFTIESGHPIGQGDGDVARKK